MFKWNYEQHLYTHTLIPINIINRFASTNEPLTINIIWVDLNLQNAFFLLLENFLGFGLFLPENLSRSRLFNTQSNRNSFIIKN